MDASQAADWIEILEIRSKYGWFYDSPDLEGLMALFAADAVCDFGPYGEWVGRQAIREGFEENMGKPGNAFPTLHSVANPIIEIDGDTATGRFFLLDFVLTEGPGRAPMGVAGLYFDEYRKEDGSWVITHTRLRFLWNSQVGRFTGEAQKLDWHADQATA